MELISHLSSPAVLPALLAIIGVVFLFVFSVVVVGGEEIAVLERRWFGKPMPEGRVVAMSNEVGIQARILGPGMHILFPFLYKVTKSTMVQVNENEVGLVDAIDGVPVSAGRIFARSIQGHNLFQDGEAFLTTKGEKGPQIEMLPPGIYRVNPYLFRIVKVPAVSIGNNQIGVVVATDGAPIEPGRLLGRSAEGHDNFQNGQSFLTNGGQKGPQIDVLLPGTYRINPKLFEIRVVPATVVPAKKVGLVTARDGQPLPQTEYVARTTPGHRDFQDAAAFLAAGGERGPQLDFMKPGTYYVNPLMFDVVPDEVLLVQRGEVGVIVSNIGKEPQLASEDKGPGFERYVVDAGFRGIQREVLGPGTYYLNKLAFTHHIIPTTNITIDWAEESVGTKSPRVFNPLSIVSKDGFEMSVEVKVIIRVQPEQAPHMVSRIGTIENLIEHVIHPLIDSSFRNQASSGEAMKFMQDRHEEQRKAEAHVVEELRKYHAECVSVLICQIKLPERLMQTMTDRVVATQQKSMYDAQQEAEGRRREMENTKAQADLQPSLVRSKIDVEIAEQQKRQNVILAEGRGQATKLEQEGVAAGIASVGKAEGERVLAVGRATAEAYFEQAKAVGSQSLALIEVMKKIADGQVKITPDIFLQSGAGDESGNGATNGLVTGFLASMMRDQARGGTAGRTEKSLPATPAS